MAKIHVPQPEFEKTPTDLIANWRHKSEELFATDQGIAATFRQCADDLERLLAGKVVTP